MANLHLDASYDEAAYTRALKAAMDARAPVYDTGENGDFHHVLNAKLLELYPFQSPVLDVACGTGHFCGLVAAAGGSVTGVDISPGMLQMARRLMVDVGVGLDVRFVEADARAIPFPDGTFGSVYVCTALAYFIDVPAVLAGFRRVLRKDGFAAYQANSGDSYVIGVLLAEACVRALGESAGRKAFEVPNTVTDSEDVNRALMTEAGFKDVRVESTTEYTQLEIARLEDMWGGGLNNPLLGRVNLLDATDREKVQKCFWECVEERKLPDGTIAEKVTSWFVQGWNR